MTIIAVFSCLKNLHNNIVWIGNLAVLIVKFLKNLFLLIQRSKAVALEKL